MSAPDSFPALNVPAKLCEALSAQNITIPTPIQAATLPDALAGRDVLGRGRTGSGKTFAFLLPVVARLVGNPRRSRPGQPRALILAPTRELANQIDGSLKPLAAVAKLTSRTIYGGVNQRPQVKALEKGVDIIIACPGRLEDLMAQGHASLAAVEITVLDEADLMADLGFMPSVQRLLKATPSSGQRLLFSATLDNAVQGLVDKFLSRPVIHEADSAEVDEEGVMSHHVLQVNAATHTEVLVDLAAAPGRTIIFARTKYRATKIAKQLNAVGIPATELQGNMSQNARSRSMAAFHSGAATALVATDIAARGIHVDDVELVVHADPPAEHKAYLHRSGRTARAGRNGTVVTLMLDGQRRSVRELTRKAGIDPTITKIADTKHQVLGEIAPGKRAFPGAFVPANSQEACKSTRNRPKNRSGGARWSESGSASAGGRAKRSDSSEYLADSSRSKRSASGSAGGSSRPQSRRTAGQVVDASGANRSQSTGYAADGARTKRSYSSTYSGGVARSKRQDSGYVSERPKRQPDSFTADGARSTRKSSSRTPDAARPKGRRSARKPTGRRESGWAKAGPKGGHQRRSRG